MDDDNGRAFNTVVAGRCCWESLLCDSSGGKMCDVAVAIATGPLSIVDVIRGGPGLGGQYPMVGGCCKLVVVDDVIL